MRQLLAPLLQGRQDAVDLCLLVFNWANDYDHLADDDPQSCEGALHRAMWSLAVDIPENTFYQQHQEALRVTLANGVSTWRIATALQRGPSAKGHELAHVLRWTPVDFFLHCARLVGGESWVQQVGPAFWVAMTEHHSFDDFARECGRG